MDSYKTPVRKYAPGIGDAVADRTINRKLDPNTFDELPAWGGPGPDMRPYVRETWEQVAFRVAHGNSQLTAKDEFDAHEFHRLHHHLRQASVLMSGRHLQHTDPKIGTRNQEVLTNCSTSASSTILFYLLLNGSGVGRAYDDDMMVVDWCNDMPNVRCWIRDDHPDVLSGEIGQEFTSYFDAGDNNVHFMVPDSREGWAKAVERVEAMTWAKRRNVTLVLDFSEVRERGAPIGGMQNRPASGPGPLMNALKQIATLKGSGMDPWKATLHVDHYLAECVLVGGARRAARMSTKSWRDKNVLNFVTVKQGGILWSSNNSVTVDADFWNGVFAVQESLELMGTKDAFLQQAMLAKLVQEGHLSEMDLHAFAVYVAVTHASYHDGTGEPGLINVDMLTQNDAGIDALLDGNFAESQRFKLDSDTKRMLAQVAGVFANKKHNMIVNPCGEIPLSMLGGYCVIADVVPFHAGSDFREGSGFFLPDSWDKDAEDAFRTATRALLRVNTMDCLYAKEVKRTNRIGVGFTGIHEYAYARFGYGWKDLVNEERSLPFWKMMSRFSRAIVDEAAAYSEKLGVNMPHTVTTVKPAGTTSKLFDLTEGAHLPSMREYIRWVQFRSDDPLIAEYRAKGYPVRELKTYSGTTIVGFPTVPQIVAMGMGDALVTAAEATPEEQYEWLRLLEKYWLHGYKRGEGMGDSSIHPYGGQVSYTLKYDPKSLGYLEFSRTLLEGQSSIKACSVMPQTDATAYEYQPEEPVSKERFAEVVAGIHEIANKEDIGFEHVDCGTGACPIDFIGSER